MFEPDIRKSILADLPAIEKLYPAAFPDEDLLPLVKDLLQEPSIVLSLVATIESRLAGHVIFTKCSVEGSDARAALLAPLAVAPSYQRQGIGSAIVRSGLEQLEDAGVSQVFVLGDPAWYSRLGFKPEPRVDTPYPLPEEWRDAWQSLFLGGTVAPQGGKIALPPRWMKPELWSI